MNKWLYARHSDTFLAIDANRKAPINEFLIRAEYLVSSSACVSNTLPCTCAACRSHRRDAVELLIFHSRYSQVTCINSSAKRPSIQRHSAGMVMSKSFRLTSMKHWTMPVNVPTSQSRVQ